MEKLESRDFFSPYISPERIWTREEKNTVVRRNLQIFADGLVAGDVILLWRVSFGTFTTESWFPKYFEYDYGIHGASHLEKLLEEGYLVRLDAFASLKHINSREKRGILQTAGLKGLSKYKAADLNRLLEEHFSEEELGKQFGIRGYDLTEKGKAALAGHQEVVDRHPKKG